MAVSTAGSSQLRSGCSGSKMCRYHWPVVSSLVQAGRVMSKVDTQLLGGRSPGARVAPHVPIAVCAVP